MFKKIKEKLFKEEFDTPLNYFIQSYYYSLKGNELDEAYAGVNNCIDRYNNTICEMKDIIKNNCSDTLKELLTKNIEDLEYTNTTSFEILRLIDYLKLKEIEKQNKKAKRKKA